MALSTDQKTARLVNAAPSCAGFPFCVTQCRTAACPIGMAKHRANASPNPRSAHKEASDASLHFVRMTTAATRHTTKTGDCIIKPCSTSGMGFSLIMEFVDVFGVVGPRIGGPSFDSSDERSAPLQVRTLARIELIERKIFTQAKHLAVNFSKKISQQILNLSG